MNKKIIITIVAVVLLLGAGVAMASTDSNNPFQIIWQAITGLQDRVNQSEIKIECLELVKKTPDRGPGEWININIVEFYEESLRRYEEVKINSSRPEEQNADIAFYEEVLAEAKPLYDQYLEKCK